MISAIYAQGRNGEIGLNGGLPWRLPADLKMFKHLTEGETCVCGKGTYESIKHLKNRNIMVLSNEPIHDLPENFSQATLDEVIELSKRKNIIVIGGANVYKQLMPYTSYIVRTTINRDFEADTYMCDIDEPSWRVSDGKYYHDEETGYDYRIEILKRSVNNEAVS